MSARAGTLETYFYRGPPGAWDSGGGSGWKLLTAMKTAKAKAVCPAPGFSFHFKLNQSHKDEMQFWQTGFRATFGTCAACLSHCRAHIICWSE